MKILKAPPPLAERPRCPNCDKPLRPRIHREYDRRNVQRQRPDEFHPGQMETYTQVTSFTVSMEWLGDYHGYGDFCTLLCCESFANAAYKAGYRIKRR